MTLRFIYPIICPIIYTARLSAILLLLLTSVGKTAEYILPPKGFDVIGQAELIAANDQETLFDIARRYGLGFNEISKANPDVDPWYPGAGTPVVIPTRFILPDTPREGIVLNLPEMRLYYYPEPQPGEPPKVITYPAGIGQMDWETPIGKTYISEKRTDPTWTPPTSIREKYAALGEILPDVVPAGPENPLGTRAMRLGLPSYLIHGTNKPDGVGMRISHGCVRLRQEDIEALFDIVPVKTNVNIVNQPLKIGYFADQLFMEFHSPLEEDGLTFDDNYRNAIQTANAKLDLFSIGVSESTIKAVVEEESGLPVQVTH
ncbi:L,D-transpeptidase family protein [Ostreibacterium oceani]|uniref:L,D-transpeptidase family protein n=1 Tax=Ostreibacterium oceani TaxID=2654998 RepID=A0A6N7ESD8_9GAMM|nr:L,D-transpeptidase family protein [Ostreibacterium oceani]MPV85412.1 L,D-transpeptidase family protein [Ostreibacterium oceani]